MSDAMPPAVYFGRHWGAPALTDAVQAPTPLGQPCLRCKEPVVDGDRGWIRVAVRAADDATAVPVHAECELLGIIGHDFGVCRCTGWDTTSRAAAVELWARVAAYRPA